MKSLWINSRRFALACLALCFACSLTAQDAPPPDLQTAEPKAVETKAVETKAVAKHLAAVAQLEELLARLRAFQPGEVHQLLQTSNLDSTFQNFFKGWAFHQEGKYEQAYQFFKKVKADDLGSDPYFANRLEELTKTAEELKDFAVLETDNFSIRYQSGPEEVLLFYLPEILESIYREYSRLFHYEREEKIIVELMPDHRLFSFASALSRAQIETTGTIALCVENRLVVLTPRRVLQGYEWPDTIAHEFVHYVLTKLSRDHVPLWMQEGVAKAYEARWERPEAKSLDEALETSLALAVKDNKFLKVEDMMPSFAALPTAQLAQLAYAQTATMIDYLREIHGDQVVRNLVLALREDRDIEVAMKAVAGKSFESFEADWRQWTKKQGYRVHEDIAGIGVKLLDQDASPEEIKELSAKDETNKKHTRLGDLLLERKRYQAAQKEYRKTFVKGKPLDRQIILRMLKCYHSTEQNEQLLAFIDEHVRHLDRDTTMQLYKAEAFVNLGRNDEARTLLDRTIRVNPFNPNIYRIMQRALDKEHDKPQIEMMQKILDILSRRSAASPPKEIKS